MDPIYSALPQPRRPIFCVQPETSVIECITMMVQQDIGALVVLNNEELVGMVTERDIVRGLLYTGLDINNSIAADVVYTDVSVLDVFEPVEEAMSVITKTKRRHILVSENNEIVALLSIGDLLFHLLEDKTRVIEQLENYIHS